MVCQVKVKEGRGKCVFILIDCHRHLLQQSAMDGGGGSTSIVGVSNIVKSACTFQSIILTPHALPGCVGLQGLFEKNRTSSYIDRGLAKIGRCRVKHHHSHKLSQLNTVPLAMVILPCQALQSISISAWVKFRRNTPGLELSSAHVVNGVP